MTLALARLRAWSLGWLTRLGIPLSDGIVLLILFVSHAVISRIWLENDHLRLFRQPDDFAHYAGVQKLVAAMDMGGVLAALKYLGELNSHYSFWGYYPMALFTLLFGGDPPTQRLGNLVFLALLFVGLYTLGVACHGRRAGLLAAAFVGLTPAVFCGQRTYGLDFPALCIMPWPMLMLVRSDGFRRPRPSLAFGVLAGLTAMVRPQSLIFLFFPACWALGRRLWTWRAAGRREPLSRVLRSPALAVGLILFITAPWWLGRLGYLSELLVGHTDGQAMITLEGDPSAVGGILYYVKTLPLLLSGVLAAAWLLLTPCFVRATRHRAVLLLWILGPLVLHMVVFMLRHYRYLYPLVPAVALAIGVGLATLRPWARATLSLTLGTLSLGLTLVSAFEHHVIEALAFCTAESGPACRTARRFLDLRRVNMDNDLQGDPLPFLLCSGNVRFCSLENPGPKLRALRELSRPVARRIRARHPDGRKAVVYYDLFLTHEVAIPLQERLPELRLWHYGQMFDQAEPILPGPDWRRYVLQIRPVRTPLPQRPLVLLYRPFDLPEGLFDRGDSPTGRYRLVLWRLPPGHPWTPSMTEFR